MRIIQLKAENIKRLRAIEISPDGALQVVTGRNAQGKSSVLDAIWFVLGGGPDKRMVPELIRQGEDQASVSVDLGDLVVTKTWRRDKGTVLSVVAADGVKYSSPQGLLDQLVGRLSFDPLAFTRLKPSEQREALLELVGLDFAKADRERAGLYEERLETGRAANAYGELPKLAEDASLVEQSTAGVVARISAAVQVERANDKVRTDRDLWAAKVVRLQEQIDALGKELAAAEAFLADAAKEVARLVAPEPMEVLQAELSVLEEANRRVRDNQALARRIEEQAVLRSRYTDLTHQIEGIDKDKAEAIKTAIMPVAGLGFDDQGVTFNQIPFAQASSAEQIKVSLAMAIALNPTLRVVRIMDGSLLDADSMRMIAQMAVEQDMQVWIERVEDDSPSAVVIEDGQVAA